MKSDRMKKSVALCVMTVSILIYGVCYSDEMEFIRNTSNPANDQLLSIPADQVPFISDEFPGLPKPINFIDAPVIDHHLMHEFNYSVPIDSIRRSYDNKLFQLLSTYRL